MTKPKWQIISPWTICIVDGDGKILGQVAEISYTFYASANKNDLGNYINQESAKKAVEKELKL